MKELKIEIDKSYFEDRNNRFVTELGLSIMDAEAASNEIRDLVKAKINEQDKN